MSDTEGETSQSEEVSDRAESVEVRDKYGPAHSRSRRQSRYFRPDTLGNFLGWMVVIKNQQTSDFSEDTPKFWLGKLLDFKFRNDKTFLQVLCFQIWKPGPQTRRISQIRQPTRDLLSVYRVLMNNANEVIKEVDLNDVLVFF